MSAADVREAITRAHHEEWARLVAALTRRFGDLDTYQGQAAFRAQALPGCKASAAAVVDRSKLTATMSLIWIYPEPQAWADGPQNDLLRDR